MQHTIKTIISFCLALLVVSNVMAEDSSDSSDSVLGKVDSAGIVPPEVSPVAETYMLAHGRIKTTVGAYNVNIIATKSRCSPLTTPQFTTSIASIDVYGASQAIEGVNNTLELNPYTYAITGVVSAPVNVVARDNGAMVNWQIWCRPIESA